MCGRYFNDNENERILSLYEKAKDVNPNIDLKNGDICPGDIAPLLNCENRISVQKWGIENPYKKNAIIINSRSETILEKFKPYFENSRSVIPCSGYYEWTRDKEKYYFDLSKEKILFLCGISTGKTIDDRFSIITREACDEFHNIHPRMPLILEEKYVTKYLFDYDFAKYILNHGIEKLAFKKV